MGEKLSDSQRKLLERCLEQGGLAVWHGHYSTFKSLVKRGYIDDSNPNWMLRYDITAAGRAALGEGSVGE